MQPIIVLTELFKTPKDRARSERCLYYMLEAMTLINESYLRANPRTPLLYQSGVRYSQECRDEQWQDIPVTLKRGYADCEDLATYRVAELRVRFGERRAKVFLKHHYSPLRDHYTYHVMVRRANGKIEDPSRRLGMLTRLGKMECCDGRCVK